ncbi:hypothetical protein [Enterococcus avium]|uniref:hypothetical protein n=1 Tax=Enterococcus avium TaxID=33945 RepID=UPI0032E51936
MARTNKTKEELLKELELLEKKENEELEEKHNLTILKGDEQVDVLTLPKKKFNAIEKSKIVTSLAVLNAIKEELQDVIHAKDAAISDWLMMILIFDEITTEVLGIAYDQKDTLIPSLPNFDLLAMFLEENQSWIGEKAKLAITQINAVSEEAKTKE